MAIQFIDGKEEVQKKISDKGITLLNFYADWCGPCQMFNPILEELSNDVTVIKVNADKNLEFTREKAKSGIPSTWIYKDGKEVENFTGFVPLQMVKKKIEAL